MPTASESAIGVSSRGSRDCLVGLLPRFRNPKSFRLEICLVDVPRPNGSQFGPEPRQRAWNPRTSEIQMGPVSPAELRFTRRRIKVRLDLGYHADPLLHPL